MIEQLPQVFLADHALHLDTGRYLIELFSLIQIKVFLDSRLIPLHDEYKSNTIENLTDELKNILVNGISRKRADEWRRRWFRIYAYHGQL